MDSAALRYAPNRLVESAQEFADEAFKNYRDSRWGLFSLHAGATVEFLAKAALAHTNPLLLAEASGSQLNTSLLHFAGAESAVDQEPKTVSLTTAIKRLEALHSELEIHQEDVQRLVEARNAATHLGLLHQPGLPLLRSFVRSADSIVERTPVAPGGFWGRNRPLVVVVLSDFPDEESSDTAIRIQQARIETARWSERAAELDARARVSTVTLAGHQETGDCPVCASVARYSGEHWVEGDAVMFRADELLCAGCGLHLVGPRALDQAEAPARWSTQHDVSSFREGRQAGLFRD